MGIFRSLGALSRAVGPFIASIGKINLLHKIALFVIFILFLVYWSFGVNIAYLFGAIALFIPLCILIKSNKEKIKSI